MIGHPERLCIRMINSGVFMSILTICTYPDPVLMKKCKEIENLHGNMAELADDMVETLLESENGIGLAAPQVGQSVKLVVVELEPEEERGNPEALFNPRIVEASGSEDAEEGCLSLPNHFGMVTRATHVLVEAIDKDGNEVSLEAEGLLARCLQHELDHLDGKLVVDYASSLKRAMYRKRRLKELKKEQG
jgi:peptide deformylase